MKSAFRSAIVLTALTLCLGSTSVGVGQQMPSSWDCLPDDTMLAVRIPNGQAFLQALRQNSKFGAVGLSEERLGRVTELIRQQAGAAWDRMVQEMGQFGLGPDDWHLMYQGDLGYAVIAKSRPDAEPLAVGLMWAEPGGDLAARIMKAIDQAVAEQPQSVHPVRRRSYHLAGQKITHLAFPKTAANVIEDAVQIDDFEPIEEAEDHVVDYVHVMVTTMGPRILLAHSIVGFQEGLALLEPDAQKIELDAASGFKEATSSFVEFIKAHQAGGNGKFASRIMAAPGVAEAMPEGLVGIDFVMDMSRIMALIEQNEDGAEVDMIKAIGLDGLGPLAVRVSLDQTTLRASVALSAAAPRRGLLQLFDQPVRPATPAAWVDSSVASYSHLNVDLASTYQMLKEILSEAMEPQQAQMIFGSAEMFCNMMTRTDVSTFLGSIGEQHIILQYPPREGADSMPSQQRVAFIWDLKDEQVWLNLIQSLMAQAGQAQGGPQIKQVQMHGFSGVHVDVPGTEGGLFIGHRRVVVAVGPGVSEQVLSMVAQGPVGGSLRDGALYRQGSQILPPRPGISYSITDSGPFVRRSLKAVKKMVQAGASGVRPGAFDQQPQAIPAELAAVIEQLLPTEAEVVGMFGVNVQQAYVTDGGLVMQAALELSPNH